MVKETKYLKRMATKAEVFARVSADEENAKRLLDLAKGFRAQAKVLKKEKKKPRNKPSKKKTPP